MKLNEFEKYLIVNGLEHVEVQMKLEIKVAIDNGKRPLMTEDYVEMMMKELKDKLNIKPEDAV
jgi:hypothetical protein